MNLRQLLENIPALSFKHSVIVIMDMDPHIGAWDRQLTHWINFRNSHKLIPVVVQSFMVLCALVIVLGLIYVIILVLAIAVHHIVWDRDPKKVPDYVKNSIQFSSESEASETDVDEEDGGEDDKDTVTKASNYVSTQRKLAALDKFIGSSHHDHDEKNQ